jgi:hypothetical protein
MLEDFASFPCAREMLFSCIAPILICTTEYRVPKILSYDSRISRTQKKKWKYITDKRVENIWED